MTDRDRSSSYHQAIDHPMTSPETAPESLPLGETACWRPISSAPRDGTRFEALVYGVIERDVAWRNHGMTGWASGGGDNFTIWGERVPSGWRPSTPPPETAPESLPPGETGRKCLSCERDPTGELHARMCTDGPDCIKHQGGRKGCLRRRSDCWDTIAADPALANARSKLSMHEFRLIILHAKASMAAPAEPPEWFKKYVVPHRQLTQTETR